MGTTLTANNANLTGQPRSRLRKSQQAVLKMDYRAKRTDNPHQDYMETSEVWISDELISILISG